ncbi:hypothetical protein B0H19DRAFT_1265200 [Mycena capillaripes]|nr:hypothetical protein B0H19DRAFT_1265200 [Mycena capillaripes]
MQRIVEALASKKAWAVDLVAYWDRILFPDADRPHANAAGSAGDQADEDDDDFFGSAPALATVTGRHRPDAAIRPRPSPVHPHRLAATVTAIRPRCRADWVTTRHLHQAVVTEIARKAFTAVVVEKANTV